MKFEAITTDSFNPRGALQGIPRLFRKWTNTKFSAITEDVQGNHLFNNTNRVARILYRLSAYRRLSWHMWRRGISAREILRTQFPLIEPNPRAPALLTIEFTNSCNLRCSYCTSPSNLRPRGFMAKTTFERLLEGVKELGVSRVRVVGNGEPTLHPEFRDFVCALAKNVPFVSVLSNGHWIRPAEVIETVLLAPVSLIEISVGGGDKESFENSRRGGCFESLLGNLTALRAALSNSRAKTIINIRLMLSPSERPVERRLAAFWRNYADTVMPQYVREQKHITRDDDTYIPVEFADQSYPKCSEPFKALGVNWNGNVPLCSNSAQQMGGSGLVIGNVKTDGLADLWNGAVLRQYREGHRQRDATKMSICKGCQGC